MKKSPISLAMFTCLIFLSAVLYSQSIVGKWDVDMGNCKNEWSMFKDGTGKLMGSCTSSRNGKWTFSKKVFTFVDGYGSTFKGEVEWINENYFILTIIDNGSIFERGMKRHFKRAKNGLNSDAPPSYRDANNCKTCKGKGVYTCGNCSGNGYGNFVGQEWHYEYINGEYKNVYGWGVFWKECPICLGTGKITCHH